MPEPECDWITARNEYVPLCLSSSWLTRRSECAYSSTTAGHSFPCWSTSSPLAIIWTRMPGRERPRDSASPPYRKYDFSTVGWPLMDLQHSVNKRTHWYTLQVPFASVCLPCCCCGSHSGLHRSSTMSLWLIGWTTAVTGEIRAKCVQPLRTTAVSEWTHRRASWRSYYVSWKWS